MLRQFGTTFLLFILIGATAYAQGLYQPRNINIAYQNGTRDTRGMPGPYYWQNHARYDIKLMIHPKDNMVYGKENIRYFNNSPDSLKGLHFKLFPNHHKPGAVRAYQVPEEYLTDGVTISTYKENGQDAEWKDDNDGTNKFIDLNTPLLPGDSVNLYIEWHYQLGARSGREGQISENTYFLAYFYPRIAVYDDYVGWDIMPHTMAQEFYSDFNDYTFEVTVPGNYLVWATGELQNGAEVLQPEYYNRFLESQTSDELISIVGSEDLKHKQVTTLSELNVWKWQAHNVPDIAIGTSSEYYWDASSVLVDKQSGRRSSVQAAYDSASIDFRQMVDHSKHAIQWYSENIPGIPYPYPAMTVVRGHADMEYPMMANDSSFPHNPEIARAIAQHEIAHTYFPFYMGTNETRYGFMDEGWATAMEYLIAVDDIGKEIADNMFKRFRVQNWIQNSTFDQDIPIITPSHLLNRPAMSYNMYGKAGLAYLALRDMLGEITFKSALHEYMERWNGKHPMPWDFFYTFNHYLKRDLNWFWDAWFFSNNYIDLAIDKVSEKRRATEITIQNIGGMPVPFDLIIETATGKVERLHYSPEIWEKELYSARIKLKDITSVKSVVIDGGIWMDANTSDNLWTK